MKPVIGITSYIKKDVFRNYSQVGYEYIDKIEKANGIPMIIPVLQKYDEKELNKIIDFIDGIIFTGGCNVESQWYGEKPLKEEPKEDLLRNHFERDLFLAAKKRKKPILGVCRGCQLINVMQGGSLVQNIDNQLKTEVYHKGTGCKIDEKIHKVTLCGNYLLKDVYNEGEVQVNSFHEQCIKKVGPDLKVAAKCCEDGVIEGVEYEGDFYMTGVQWHPEGMEDEKQFKLFEEFVEICSKNEEALNKEDLEIYQ